MRVRLQHVGIIQSLIVTYNLDDINPRTDLTDVLLRINEHPASRAEVLTPWRWKQLFIDHPMRSDLYIQVKYVAELTVTTHRFKEKSGEPGGRAQG